MKFCWGVLFVLLCNISYGQSRYEKDFIEFWNDVNENYAYLDQQHIDWQKVKSIYMVEVKSITNDDDFIRFMEKVLNELHNGHISLNTNLSSSNRIIPSGMDLFVQKKGDQFMIVDIRKGSGADRAGLKIGDQVVLFNNQSIPEQLVRFLPKYTHDYTGDMYQYALSMLFAGTHQSKRILTIEKKGRRVDYFPDSLPSLKTDSLIEAKILNGTTAYIKFNNSLGDLKTIGLFDKALDGFIGFQNIILDLTETPSGGNTTVARCIMGRFINKSMPYQQHEYDEKEFQTKRKWVEYVIPRKTQYRGNLFVLVGHWTGSMGEGLAIGFDGLKRAKIIGTEMAGLLGAINGFTMSETKIGFQIPTERLYHINGLPREKFKPSHLTKNIEETYQSMKEIK